MKRNFVITLGIFSALSAPSVIATPQPVGSNPPSKAQEAQVSKLPSHVVSPGDSLEKIARLHGCKVSDLLKSNGLKTDSLIHPGQKLQLPAKDLTQVAANPTPRPTSTQPAAATHTVAAGETFAAIARQHSIPLADLLAANPEIKPTALRPGHKISLGLASASDKTRSLETGNTQMILATKESAPLAGGDTSPAPVASPPAVKIQQIKIDQEMTYNEFASRQGTNTKRLNQLNGLDLLDSALLAKGSELLAPAQP